MAKLAPSLLTTLSERFGALPTSDYVPDVLAPGLDVVFCGTALGYQSAQAQAYYAHPGNFFWRTLYATGLTPHQLTPAEYMRALDYGIGLTDLCKNAYGNDTQLPAQSLDGRALGKKIDRYQPRFLGFTSKTAASAFLGQPTGSIRYGLQEATAGKTRLFVLPSPSGQARVFWNVSVWQSLADHVKAARPTAD